mgnify:CR=1 FL=1
MSSHPGDELGTSPLAREAFESLESMLEPSVLGALIGRAVASVRREPFETSGWSSTEATFERVVVDGGDVPGLVVKIVDRARDWLAITSEDAVDREVRVWEMGLLDRLPPPMSHAVIACSRGESGYAVLMHDVSEFLFASDETVSMDDQPIVLDAVAALHARFWMDPSLRSAELGLCTVRQVTSSLAPSVPARLRPIVGSIELLDAAEEGWATLRSLEPRFYDRLAVVAEDSRALEAALAEYPWTLARGDVRPPNVGIDRDRNRVVMLDWAIPACGPPALDLAWWLFSSYTLVDSGVDPIVAIYREALERHRSVPVEDEWWAPSFGLSALSLMSTLAPFIATYQSEMLPWWIEQAEGGLELIG